LELKRYKGRNLLDVLASVGLLARATAAAQFGKGSMSNFAADVIFGRIKEVGEFRSDILEGGVDDIVKEVD
jgi:hypothetical protein